MSGIEAAIEGLYAAFAGYPLRARVEGCPHCEFDEAGRGLHRAPLRALGEDELRLFAFKAMTTFGDEDDFRHFLPRIAELVTREGAVGAADLAVLAGKLELAGWHEWPAAEREAVVAWWKALEDACLAGRAPLDVRGLIEASVRLGRDPSELLSRWPNARSAAALEDLASPPAPGRIDCRGERDG